ncbi:MAG: family 65 glycosyl hydrolase [Spirochaetes bacterium]|nr:family 65 glycosyl hydrolase [Spirochaetota bacterium]
MLKKGSNIYYEIHPWSVIENGFDPEKSKISESLFSLANEYMGIRGYFDEGYSGNQLIGSYLNSLYEEKIINNLSYQGLSNRIAFMVNTVDWLYTRIIVDDEQLDLAVSQFSNFTRKLDFRTGVYSRSFIWNTQSGRKIKFKFERLLGRFQTDYGIQKITIEPLNFSGSLLLTTGLDFSNLHEGEKSNFWNCLEEDYAEHKHFISAETINTKQKLLAAAQVNASPNFQYLNYHFEHNCRMMCYELTMKEGMQYQFEKFVLIQKNKNSFDLNSMVRADYHEVLVENKKYWENIWKLSDIRIEGDTKSQQAIRFGIFHLHQTYQGKNSQFNIGAKGLTGEVYSGHTFWDTETYCLTYYLFNNPQAAQNLLKYRYHTLPQALQRSKELDCQGAFYPIATIDGKESCTLWQHSNLQLQATTGVAYGIWHYEQVTKDIDFVLKEGLEMLIQICRFLASRAQQDQKSGQWGYYGVMGPDEFQMMVHNNCYTNYLAKRTFQYTIEKINQSKTMQKDFFDQLVKRLNLSDNEILIWQNIFDNIVIHFDEETALFEQHDGFFDLPHVDIRQISNNDFPLYHHWSYDRIYRNDMIKQPDVLMFLFLYNSSFTRPIKKANYDYYESRCIHESSLSPSVHSVLACELDYYQEAYHFFLFAGRLDLDNYNCNTQEGLHITSLAGAWINVVYGFGGMRSDAKLLAFNPVIPKEWEEYQFKVKYEENIISVIVNQKEACFILEEGKTVTVKIGNQEYQLKDKPLIISLKENAEIGV